MFSTDIWLQYPKILKLLFTEENTYSLSAFIFHILQKS